MPRQIPLTGMTVKYMLSIVLPGAGYLALGMAAFFGLDSRVASLDEHIEGEIQLLQQSQAAIESRLPLLETLPATVKVIQLAQDTTDRRLDDHQRIPGHSGMITDSNNTRLAVGELRGDVKAVQDDVSEIKADIGEIEKGQRQILDILSGRGPP